MKETIILVHKYKESIDYFKKTAEAKSGAEREMLAQAANMLAEKYEEMKANEDEPLSQFEKEFYGKTLDGVLLSMRQQGYSFVPTVPEMPSVGDNAVKNKDDYINELTATVRSLQEKNEEQLNAVKRLNRDIAQHKETIKKKEENIEGLKKEISARDKEISEKAEEIKVHKKNIETFDNQKPIICKSGALLISSLISFFVILSIYVHGVIYDSFYLVAGETAFIVLTMAASAVKSRRTMSVMAAISIIGKIALFFTDGKFMEVFDTNDIMPVLLLFLYFFMLVIEMSILLSSERTVQCKNGVFEEGHKSQNKILVAFLMIFILRLGWIFSPFEENAIDLNNEGSGYKSSDMNNDGVYTPMTPEKPKK